MSNSVPIQLQVEAEREYRKRHRATAPIWYPDPRNKPQCLAYELAKSGAVMEIGFGGQAFGGKSELILGVAATLFERSRIMRKEFPQLDALIARGNQLFPVPFVGGEVKKWRFDNKTIALRSMSNDNDWKKYQGQDIQFLGVDEAAEFHENPIRALTGWLRSGEGKRTLIIFGFNPPTTPEGEWIIRYFAPWIDPQYPNPAESGEIRWLAHLPGLDNTERIVERPDGTPFIDEISGQKVWPISRTFIRSSRHDNPYLSEEYERRLQSMREPLRTMITTGDFTIGIQDDPWQVIPTSWVLEAQERWRNTVKPSDIALRAIGNDVAHGGADNTVIARLYGVYFDELLIYPGASVPDGATGALHVKNVWDGRAPIAVDGVGYGASAADTMKSWDMRPTVVNFGMATLHTDKSKRFRFFNLRAEAYWRLYEALNPASGENICLPPSRTLRADLCAPTYKIVEGKIKLEPKEDIKKRLGRSPDEGDTIVLCWYAAISIPNWSAFVA